nr:hypothetical protein [Tanacetum cinerariifolium]
TERTLVVNGRRWWCVAADVEVALSVTMGHGPAVDGGVVFSGDGAATMVWMRLEVAWCSADRGGGSPEVGRKKRGAGNYKWCV